MSELGLIPIRKRCIHCGNIYEEGLVHADFYPVQDGWLCPACHATLPKRTWLSGNTNTNIRKIIYDKRYTEFFLNCKLCKQAPCKHMKQDEKGNWILV